MKKEINVKAIVMFSGGLDSSLVVRILQEQGIAVEALHFKGPFHSEKFRERESHVGRFAREFNLKLIHVPIEEDFIGVLKNPRYGYGANINPCIDCRIYTLKKAKEYMLKSAASFIATGEVIGQRPMSQRKDMIDLVEKRAGLKGFLLRPLSAKLLEPTVPEKDGLVNREKLFAISGRSRQPQMGLAEKFGVKDYPAPAGGCLLTDPNFTIRLKDLLAYDNVTNKKIELLQYGRHFRLSKAAKAIVGRNKEENARLLELADDSDLIVKLKDMPGPITIIRGIVNEDEIRLASALTARYSKAREANAVEIIYCAASNGEPDNESGQMKKMSRSISIEPTNETIARQFNVETQNFVA